MGIKSIEAANIDNLIKWAWKFKTYLNSTWSNVIKAIHGRNGVLDCGQQGVMVDKQGPWRDVGKAINTLTKIGISFEDISVKQIGNGNNKRFWTDFWKGDSLLKDIFNGAFELEKNQDVTVAERLSSGGT